MDFIQVYAIAIGAVFGVALFINGWPWISRFVRPRSALISKYLVYRYVLHRHRLLGPWSWADALLQLIYVTGNILCITLGMPHGQTQISTLSQAGQRAGTLSIINLIPLFAGLHLSTLSDLLGANLRTVRQIHRAAGVMASLLMVFHALVGLRSQSTFSLNQARNLFGVIGVSSMTCVILLFISVFRRISYELFLRIHQVLAALVVFAVWRHLPSGSSFARNSLYVLVGLFLFLCIVQVVIVFYQNGLFRPGRAEAEITHVYGAIRLRIQCRKPVQFQPGQYINLWMPSLSFWSFLQSHPFIVISWADKPQEYLDLFVEPRGGLTQKLLSRAQKVGTTHFPLLFSGPHGRSIRMDDSEKILLVASDLGIAAQLPYLKRLIRGYNERRLRAQRVHLVWQVRDLNLALAAETLLNGLWTRNTLDDGRIIDISIYCAQDDVPRTSFGKRAHVFAGPAPLGAIFQAEIAGRSMEKKSMQQVDWNTQRVVGGDDIEHESTTGREVEMLVTVSATDEARDNLRKVVRDHLSEKVQFFELDYQP